MAHFVKRTRIAAPAEVVFAFHERSDAFERLAPPWQHLRVLQPPKSLAVGTRVIVRGPVGPTIEAEHIALEPGHSFTDRMVRGPFHRWVHRHVVEPVGTQASDLIDDVDYELPLGVVGRIFGGPFVRHELERMFAYRHQVTRAFCEARVRAPPAAQ